MHVLKIVSGSFSLLGSPRLIGREMCVPFFFFSPLRCELYDCCGCCFVNRLRASHLSTAGGALQTKDPKSVTRPAL